MSKADAAFIHQHVVDAYTAQTASASTRKIALFYALAGLYLALEKGYSGSEVQQAHLRMTRRKDLIPDLSVPAIRGSVTIESVLQAPPGPARDQAIMDWCRSVWEAYSAQRALVIASTEAILNEEE